MQFSLSRKSTGELRQLDMSNLTFCELDIVQIYKFLDMCGMGGGGHSFLLTMRNPSWFYWVCEVVLIKNGK